MPTVPKCAVCDRLAERPSWVRCHVDRTNADKVFSVDVPLCLDCAGQTLPRERRGRGGTEGRGLGLTLLKPGCRVRIRDTPRTGPDTGRTGTVLWVKEYPAPRVAVCQVQLDERPHACTVFAAHDLEPEGTP
jgi:hypothetical protein